MKKAFTLIETILAITVITLVITAAAELASSSIKMGRVTTYEFAAYHTAEEGIEIVRNMRDSNWLRNRPWNNGLVEGMYSIQSNSTGTEYPWELLRIADAASAPVVELSPSQNYRRVITISYTDNVMHIESAVNWTEAAKEKHATVVAELTDWNK